MSHVSRKAGTHQQRLKLEPVKHSSCHVYVHADEQSAGVAVEQLHEELHVAVVAFSAGLQERRASEYRLSLCLPIPRLTERLLGNLPWHMNLEGLICSAQC